MLPNSNKCIFPYRHSLNSGSKVTIYVGKTWNCSYFCCLLIGSLNIHPKLTYTYKTNVKFVCYDFRKQQKPIKFTMYCETFLLPSTTDYLPTLTSTEIAWYLCCCIQNETDDEEFYNAYQLVMSLTMKWRWLNIFDDIVRYCRVVSSEFF